MKTKIFNIIFRKYEFPSVLRYRNGFQGTSGRLVVKVGVELLANWWVNDWQIYNVEETDLKVSSRNPYITGKFSSPYRHFYGFGKSNPIISIKSYNWPDLLCKYNVESKNFG